MDTPFDKVERGAIFRVFSAAVEVFTMLSTAWLLG